MCVIKSLPPKPQHTLVEQVWDNTTRHFCLKKWECVKGSPVQSNVKIQSSKLPLKFFLRFQGFGIIFLWVSALFTWLFLLPSGLSVPPAASAFLVHNNSC